jgi:hypothetical protein
VLGRVGGAALGLGRVGGAALVLGRVARLHYVPDHL